MAFRINKVYTRSGDNGTTGLVGGKRVAKNNLRISCYGTIDELNSVLGLVREEITDKTRPLEALIEELQHQLFDFGSLLATPRDAEYPEMWNVNERHVKDLESLCDTFNKNLPELSSFVLPGGSKISATLHLARTIARRAEREIVALSDEQGVSGFVLAYINRLSDLLFVLSRWVLTVEGKNELLWVKESLRRK